MEIVKQEQQNNITVSFTLNETEQAIMQKVQKDGYIEFRRSQQEKRKRGELHQDDVEQLVEYGLLEWVDASWHLTFRLGPIGRLQNQNKEA